VLKGILHPDDAERAVNAGVDAVQVSNHGGRQIDGELASLDALPGVVARVAGRLPVLFDSGVRGGADAVIALALGATAVAIGRPYVYALAVAGELGVRELLRNTIAELDITLGLAGVRSIAELSPGILSTSGPSTSGPSAGGPSAVGLAKDQETEAPICESRARP
jgi:lactate 2-monooxygenase